MEATGIGQRVGSPTERCMGAWCVHAGPLSSSSGTLSPLQIWVPDTSTHSLHATNGIQASLHPGLLKQGSEIPEADLGAACGGTWSQWESHTSDRLSGTLTFFLTAYAQAEGAAIGLRHGEETSALAGGLAWVV